MSVACFKGENHRLREAVCAPAKGITNTRKPKEYKGKGALAHGEVTRQ